MVLSLVVWPARAHAEEAPGRRLGLLGLGAPLRTALAIALEPWDVALVEVPDAAPSTAMPGAAADAVRITGARGLGALAWMTDAAPDHVLWLYDRETEQVRTRRVVGDPDDEAVAAALALTLKTLLRGSALVPAVGGHAVTPSASPPRPGSFGLEIDPGLRLGVVENRLVAARLGVAGTFWPPGLLGGRLGAFVRLEEGLGLRVENQEFRGRLGEHAFGAGIRAKIPLGDRLYAEPGVGGTIHVTLLDGAPFDNNGPIDLVHVDPSVDLSAALRLPIGRNVDVGVRVTAAFWTRWQRYVLDNATTFEISPVQTSAAVVLGVRLD